MSTPTIVGSGAVLVASAGAEIGNLPSWLAAVITLGGGFGWLRFVWLPRAEKRLRNAQATAEERGGDRISVDTAEEAVRFVRQEFDRVTEELTIVRNDARTDRSRADEAHTLLIKSQAELASAQATLAESTTRAANDRAILSRQIHAMEEALHVEEKRCRAISEDLETVQAQIGAKERRSTPRRSTDPPPEPPPPPLASR